MADKKPAKAQDEPSIEEILGSIRRIIAEDDTPGASKEDAVDDEPLELTNKIEPDGTIVNPAPTEPVELSFAEEPAQKVESAAPTSPPVPEPEIMAAEPVAVAPTPEIPAPTPMESPMANDFPQDDVLSDSAANAAAAAMAKLARQAAVRDEGHDGITIEGIVREMLKPLLREWLDKNLPELVQKSVERELEKLSKRV